MKIVTAAVFLALLFFSVSGNSQESAEGFNQNPEYTVPAPNKPEEVPVPNKPEASVQETQKEPEDQAAEKTVVRNRSFNDCVSEPDRGTAYQRKSTDPAQVTGCDYGGNRMLQDWERRNSPVPTSLPRATNSRSRSRSSSNLSSRSSRLSSKIQSCRSGSCSKTSSCCTRTIVVRKCCK